jgi:hypothetical protein
MTEQLPSSAADQLIPKCREVPKGGPEKEESKCHRYKEITIFVTVKKDKLRSKNDLIIQSSNFEIKNRMIDNVQKFNNCKEKLA